MEVVTEQQEITELSGLRKAAILLMCLPQDTASKLMAALSPDQVEQLAREIAGCDTVPSVLRREVVSEFYNSILARQYMNVGGISLARSLLLKSLPPDVAKHIIESIEHQLHQQPFSFLQKAETESLLMFLQNEHPQTISLVISHLPTAMASEILVGLPVELQIDVVRRIATLDQTSPEVIKEVEVGLEKRLAGLVAESSERAGGVLAVAEMLNLAGRAAEKAIMEGLDDDNPELVEEIRRLMFVFEDIMRVDDRGIQAMLKEVDNEDLALALRTATDELKDKIFHNVSERAAQLIREEMEFMGPVRVSDVEGAQQKIVDIVRRLEDSGEIIIGGKGAEKDLII